MEMEGCIGFCRVCDALIYICVYTVCTVRFVNSGRAKPTVLQ